MMGLLTGTVLGAGLGMLFAPRAGSELRGQISEQASSLKNQAQDGYRKASEAASDWAERGREAYGKVRETVARGAEDARSYIRDTGAIMRDGGTAKEPPPAEHSASPAAGGSRVS
ncbi:MAG: YtxH domain-containing protein [Acidobacteria bacterium]|nr:YtxH domain-containing protein [Acidobacteriota bacterium]